MDDIHSGEIIVGINTDEIVEVLGTDNDDDDET